MAKGKKKGKKSTTTLSKGGAGWADIDPDRLRFQHSKIRKVFSGCGRGVEDTLESIRKGELKATDLPPIQVIVGPDEGDGKGPWYFSLNNRRAWVLKRCREDGILDKNIIRVRVREPKSEAERDRYSLKNCATDAKFLREKVPTSIQNISRATGKMTLKTKLKDVRKQNDELHVDDERAVVNPGKEEKADITDDSVEDSEPPIRQYTNPFCFGDDDSSDSNSD
mmetsp:Transcript_12392/g.18641  ORF Transcript_12392/g.18641 Transcript_12392/m.18641 type:complete len:223 (+) Transcript_12392:97-765(+)